jgi:hypothetical protein
MCTTLSPTSTRGSTRVRFARSSRIYSEATPVLRRAPTQMRLPTHLRSIQHEDQQWIEGRRDAFPAMQPGKNASETARGTRDSRRTPELTQHRPQRCATSCTPTALEPSRRSRTSTGRRLAISPCGRCVRRRRPTSRARGALSAARRAGHRHGRHHHEPRRPAVCRGDGQHPPLLDHRAQQEPRPGRGARRAPPVPGSRRAPPPRSLNASSSSLNAPSNPRVRSSKRSSPEPRTSCRCSATTVPPRPAPRAPRPAPRAPRPAPRAPRPAPARLPAARRAAAAPLRRSGAGAGRRGARGAPGAGRRACGGLAGISIYSTGGETADVGDLVRTIIVDSTVRHSAPPGAGAALSRPPTGGARRSRAA